MGVEQEILGHKLHQLVFHLDHIFAGGDAGAIADAENMGVDGHGQLAKSSVKHDVGGFAADARQGFQLLLGSGGLDRHEVRPASGRSR